jgi:hypothetical protein
MNKYQNSGAILFARGFSVYVRVELTVLSVRYLLIEFGYQQTTQRRTAIRPMQSDFNKNCFFDSQNWTAKGYFKMWDMIRDNGTSVFGRNQRQNSGRSAETLAIHQKNMRIRSLKVVVFFLKKRKMEEENEQFKFSLIHFTEKVRIN